MTDAHAGSAVELEFGAEPDAVPRIRLFVTAALEGVPEFVLDDAELVVAELVTNVLLHGEVPGSLRLIRLPDRLRIEVRDRGRRLPVRARGGPDAMTGRGLGLVAALSLTWGVEPLERGKVVWAELPTELEGESEGPPSGAATTASSAEIDALLASWADQEKPEEERFDIELGSVPTDLLLEAKGHIDNLVREFTFTAAAAADGYRSPLPPQLAELVQTVVHGFADARAQIKRQALAAYARGERETHLQLLLPLAAADAGLSYIAALDEADRYARSARLLTLETPPAHRVFRRWYVESLVEQLRAKAQHRQVHLQQTLPQRLAQEVNELAPLREVAGRLARLQQVTAELTGARDAEQIASTVLSHAVSSLGAMSARLYRLDPDGMLRALEFAGADPSRARLYVDFSIDDPLPGAEAVRTGKTVITRSLAELAQRFPLVANVYSEECTLLVAPLVVGEHKLGVLSMTFSGQSAVDEDTQLLALTTLANVTAQALERAAASTAAVAASERLAFLADASVVLASSLDYRTVLDSIAELVVPRVADWCIVEQLVEGQLRQVALAHVEPAKVAWANELVSRYPVQMDSPTGSPLVVRTGESQLLTEITDEQLVAVATDAEHLAILREVGMTSALVVPMIGRTGVLGAITMIYAESGRRYEEADVAFGEDLARRAALAVETASVLRAQSGRLEVVSRVAETAQQAILSAPPNVLGPVALAARYVSASAEALVGGDLYEVVERPGAVRLLIGDVKGKGLEAVRTATVVLGEFRSAAADVAALDQVAVQIDRRLRPYLDDEDFVTGVLAEIRDDGSYVLASCGHPSALLLSGRDVTQIECPPALPLGLGAAPQLQSGSLARGERLLLYTDGLLEARTPGGEFVDVLELVRRIADTSLENLLDRVLEGLRAKVGPELGDDLALLAAEYCG